MRAIPLPTLFLDPYYQSMSSQGCKALYLTMNFIVLWSTCRSSSLFRFENCLQYLTVGTNRIFLHLKRFLLCSLVSSCFLVLLNYFCYFFLLSPHVKWCSILVCPNMSKFPLLAFRFCLDLVVLILTSFVVFRCSLLACLIFLCQIPSLYLDYIYSIPVLGV